MKRVFFTICLLVCLFGVRASLAYNVALQGTATESNPMSGYPASNAINGSTSDFSHTYNTGDEWWEVDLGAEYTIDNIVVYNRAGFLERINGATLTVLDADRNQVGANYGFANSYSYYTIDNSGGDYVGGRYIRVVQPYNYLSLCEVVVNATLANVSLDGTATQSSTIATGYEASKALDGSTTNFTHTNNSGDEWWEIELENLCNINYIVVYNRQYYESRINGATLTILDEDRNQIGASYGFANSYSYYTIDNSGGAYSGAKYIRIIQPYNYLSLCEVQAFGAYQSVDLPAIRNVALEGAAYASNSTGWLSGAQQPDAPFAIDGSDTTGSHTNGTSGDWWYVELADTCDLGSIVIFANSTHYVGDTVSVLDDACDVIWSGVGTMAYAPETFDNNGLGFEGARYIRVDAGTDSYVVVSECEAWTGPPIKSVYSSVIDADSDPGATGQSHNQTIVQNENGIFVAYLHSRNEGFTSQNWRLARSTNGGESFTTIFSEYIGTNTPCIETDEDNNIYAVVGDYSTGDASLYTFTPGVNADYSSHTEDVIPDGAAQKFAMYYDSSRSRIYYASAPQYGLDFYVLNMSGTVLSTQDLLDDGTVAHPGYPYFDMDEDDNLYLAWTTATIGGGNAAYRHIHFMRSLDGGNDWKKLDGTLLFDGDNQNQNPIVGDEGGPTDRVTTSAQADYTTWLQNFAVRSGKIHFAYKVASTPEEQHYVRWDIATAQADKRIQPEWSGGQISLLGLDGFVVTDSYEPNDLYWISRSGGQIGVLYSDDKGDTWYDHAMSNSNFMNPYMVGGCREITSDGYIIGSFTDYNSVDDSGTAYYFDFPIRNRPINVALDGTATQSSTNSTYVASMAIDDDLDNLYNFSHTNNSGNEWWKVDLGIAYDIDHIVVHNRGTLQSRLVNATLKVYANDGTTQIGSTYTFSTAVNTYTIDNSGGAFDNARYILIDQDANYLTLCEVQAWSTE